MNYDLFKQAWEKYRESEAYAALTEPIHDGGYMARAIRIAFNQGWLHREAANANPTEEANPIHGKTCPKAVHYTSTDGHLHDVNDDGPFFSEGFQYCGRCHQKI